MRKYLLAGTLLASFLFVWVSLAPVWEATSQRSVPNAEAASPDASVRDAAAPDASKPDASVRDAGPKPDAAAKARPKKKKRKSYPLPRPPPNASQYVTVTASASRSLLKAQSDLAAVKQNIEWRRRKKLEAYARRKGWHRKPPTDPKYLKLYQEWLSYQKKPPMAPAPPKL